MIKRQYGKLGLIAFLVVVAASVQVRAADMAWASGALADIYVAATEASRDLADATAKGTDAMQAVQARIKSIDEAITAALAAYADMEAAGSGEAPEAVKALENARQKALGGVDRPASTTNEEGFRLPNIYDVPWESDGLRKLYDELYQIEQSASSKGGSDFVEQDATEI